MNNINTKILTLLTTLMLLAVPIATAGNTFNVNYNVQISGFTVTITAPGETSMNFTGPLNSVGLKPSGTSNGTLAWGKIDNTGDITLTFNITAPPKTGTTLRVASNSGMTGFVNVTNTPASPSGWSSIVGGASANIFAEADFASNANKTSTIATIGSN